MKLLFLLIFLLSFQVYASDSFTAPSQQELIDARLKQQKHIEASNNLFDKDPLKQKSAFNYLRQEADSGSAFSSGKLGWAYQLGLGVKADLSKAKELYTFAANSGMTYWQFLLAHAYEQGYLGLPASPERKKYWLTYKPKIHSGLYECWVKNYYEMGIFPANEKAYQLNKNICLQNYKNQ